jgi:hypothetical protein
MEFKSIPRAFWEVGQRMNVDARNMHALPEVWVWTLA